MVSFGALVAVKIQKRQPEGWRFAQSRLSSAYVIALHNTDSIPGSAELMFKARPYLGLPWQPHLPLAGTVAGKKAADPFPLQI